jgi:RNA 2',3'-cyclic 3'-phosphodiesterase
VPENSTAAVRAFIAIELPSEAKRELTRLQQRLKQSCGNCPARWVAAGSIHLTLNFLGAMPLNGLDAVKQAMLQACALSRQFDLALDGPGAFPNLVRPSVVWVGLNGDTGKLAQLQKRLGQLLASAGFKAEDRPFSPHLTLARVRDDASLSDRLKLGQSIGSAILEKSAPIPVDSISLIQSRLTPAGPIYTVLFRAACGPA